MKRKKLVVILFFVIIMFFAFNNKASAVQDGWVQNEFGTWYYYQNGELVRDQWLFYKGSWYFLNIFGNMAEGGVHNIYGVDYRFHSDGRLYCNEYYKNLAIEYYNSSGYKQKISVGWKKIGNSWYYVYSEDGAYYISGSHKIKNKYWLFKSTGEWVGSKGWHSLTVNNYDNKGNRLGLRDDWYYIENDDGSLSVDKWLLSKNTWYYLGSNGKMAYNTAILYPKDNKYYGVDKDGKMIKNKWLGVTQDSGYYGEYTQWYYFGEDGSGISGWKNDGGWYYLKNGRCLRNTVQYFPEYDESYAFDFSCRMIDKPGWTKTNWGSKDMWDWAYVKDSSGECYRDYEWLYYNGHWYAFNMVGTMFKDIRVLFIYEGNYYEFDKDGHWIK